MFNNIGGKIKTYATVVTTLGIIGSIFAGIALGSSGGTSTSVAFIIMAVGCLVSWLSSFLLYGFGELIEQTTIIAQNTQRGYYKSLSYDEEDIKESVEDNNHQESKRYCEKCGREMYSDVCFYCQEEAESELENREYFDVQCRFCGDTLSLTSEEKNDPNFKCPFCNMPINRR